MPINTLLFDLDGTLVDQFRPGSSLQFTGLVLRRFSGLTDPVTTFRAGRAAVRALQTHRSHLSNFEAMIAAFCRVAPVDPQAVRDRVMLLAQRDFAAMAWRFRPILGARFVVDTGRRLGFRLVLATNPTVPLPMTRHRLAWAGLSDVTWDLITHPQVMTRTKPDLAYYHELLGTLQCTADQCLMIGNDHRKDLPAVKAGIRTFMLEGPTTRRDRRMIAMCPPHHRGSFADLTQLLITLAADQQLTPATSALFAPSGVDPDAILAPFLND